MEGRQIRPGLWRWTAPHPEWRPEKGKPGGWGRMVGCVCYEPPTGVADALVLVDPLVPPSGSAEEESFWSALDRDVARLGLPVAILLGNFYHERSAQEIHDRYRGKPGAAIWSHRAASGRVRCQLTHFFEGGDSLPGGVAAYPISGLENSETAYYLPPHRALLFADAVIGAGGGTLRVAPPSWAEATEQGAERYRESFRASLGLLLDLPVDIVLPSHGDIVPEAGHRALAEALAAPAWSGQPV